MVRRISTHCYQCGHDDRGPLNEAFLCQKCATGRRGQIARPVAPPVEGPDPRPSAQTVPTEQQYHHRIHDGSGRLPRHQKGYR